MTPLAQLTAARHLVVMPKGGQLGGQPGQLILDTMRFAIFDAERKETVEFLRLPAQTRFVLAGTAGTITYPFVPFSLPPMGTGDATSVYVGSGTAAEIHRYSTQGEPQAVLRWTGPDTRLTRQHMQEYREYLLRTRSRFRVQTENFLSAAPYPDRVPAYQSMMLDRTSHLWAELFRIDPQTAAEYAVFDHAARWLGNVSMPARFRATDIGADYVAGILTDEFGVERVAIYSLRKR